MAITAAIAITTVGGFGIAVFSMKYLTQMYDLSFQEASYITAGKNFIAGIGFFVAGLVIRKAKLEALGIEKLGVILLFLSGTLGLGNLARCNNVPLAGIEVPYPGESVPAGINSTCQGLCECEGFLYQPVCGPDDVVYYSPCHAGCTDNTVINNTVTYTNCSCVPGDHTVTAGECQKGCYGLYISSVCLFLSSFLFSMALSNSSIAILRCVDDDLKAFGLGTLALLSGIVGFVPSPVIIGAIVDSTCLHWSSGGSESGFCQVYDREKLSYAYSFIQLIANVIGSVLFFLAVKANITRRRKTEENNEPVQSGNTEPVQTKTNENSAQQ